MSSTATPARWAERVISATTIAAGLTLALLVAGAVLFALPVNNPRVQRCGVPAMYLLDGRVDTYVNTTKPPSGFTAAQAQAANDNRCRKRVAARAVPGALLIGAGIVVGLLAALVEWIARSARRRALLAAASAGPPPPQGAVPPVG